MHTVTTPATTSGNPGYQLGNPITLATLSAISDSTGACLTTATATGTTPIVFGQDSVLRCSSPSPCTNTYYLDSLITSTLTVQQYAAQSTVTVTVPASSTTPLCSYESYTLELVYSYSGW
jgi:hypothetical protein